VFLVRSRFKSKLQNSSQGCLSFHLAYTRNDQKVLSKPSSQWIRATIRFRFKQETELILYCDFHGHSRKQNVFLYGCENKHIPNKRLKERIFPAMLSKNDPSKVRSRRLLTTRLSECFDLHIVLLQIVQVQSAET
jgi:hypothetical protein